MTPILASISQEFFAAIYLFLAILPLLLILLLLFYRKKLQHQQIMAAIEKGLPVSEFIAKAKSADTAVNWVRSLSLGVGLLFIGVAMAGFMLWSKAHPPMVLIPIVIGGFGLIFLLRGILQKNIDKNKDK
jgi:hypothetical protein